MFDFSKAYLTERFTIKLSQVLATLKEANEQIFNIKALGVKVDKISTVTAVRDALRHELKLICEEVTKGYQGSSKSELDANEYFNECFHGFEENAISLANFEYLSSTLELDATNLEKEGLETTSQGLINHILGYQRDTLKRTAKGYVSSKSIYQYTSGTVDDVREIKDQLSVAFGVIGETVDLSCFDDYVTELLKHSYNQDMESRVIYGSKLNPIYITHFKTKMTIHFNTVLLEGVIAFASMFQPEMVESYELPVAA